MLNSAASLARPTAARTSGEIETSSLTVGQRHDIGNRAEAVQHNHGNSPHSLPLTRDPTYHRSNLIIPLDGN